MVLKMILRNHNLWETPKMATVRQRIIDISRDPQKYPVPASGWGVERDDLTKDVASKLLNRTMSTPLKDDIFLQITHRECTETNNESIDINEHGTKIGKRQKWKFTAVDGSNQTLLLRIDSTLNTAAMKLDPGSIAKVKLSFPVYFNYGDEKDERCAIVVRKFELVGKHDVPEDLLAGGGSRKPIQLKKRKAEKVPLTASLNGTSAQQQPPCCNGSLCSKNGVVFNL